ncbi:MAG TPA: Asp-tRNA(Asn)/Glu-tRNA(Gln) amidotransferase subunit GatA [Gemmatimonadaceae bacterium]|nr:Asp-tRNA(Asn)/Glu-tRNA(Gln) amidotransferase subunit GatA [Gemmatimonadaceae bacterium]
MIGPRDPRDASPSAIDAVADAFERMEAVSAGRDGLNLILWTDRPRAAEAARICQRNVDAGREGGVLAGIPYVAKDNIATTDLPTTCGSRVLENYVSAFEATAITRLRNAGAILIGKSNCDEFAMGSSTEYSAFGPARNPLDPSRVPGGSSGGSAGAVAADIVRFALGSETGGSVRQPAAFCGVVGVKPTYGRVSRSGLVAFASSLDQIGVFGKTVHDAATVLEVIAGHDPLDATSTDDPVPRYRDADERGIKGMVIGRPKEYFPSTLDPRLTALCDRALDRMRALGATVRDISLPTTDLAIPVYYIIAPAEASSNLARFDGVRYGLRVRGSGLRDMYDRTRSTGFGPEVTRRILLGTYVLSAGYYDAYYRKAQEVRALIAGEFRRTFAAGVDLIFTPTTPTVAFTHGAKSDPYEMYLSDIFTVTANLAGIPGVSVPIGRLDGLPVGGHLLAAHFDEMAMFRGAYALERALGAEAHR